MIGSRAVDLQIRTREAFVFEAEPLEESRAAQIVGPVIRRYAMQLQRAKDVVDCVAQPFAREAATFEAPRYREPEMTRLEGCETKDRSVMAVSLMWQLSAPAAGRCVRPSRKPHTARSKMDRLG
ncbi:hypothetical protein OKW40_001984 [Paraburkholderia sp. RAU6.4a]|uniref:hypothetical protein n=1 Tax=Paraburkholderia sp. RAU6.4a TaxID=2991067 RepID=UPI003D1C5019